MVRAELKNKWGRGGVFYTNIYNLFFEVHLVKGRLMGMLDHLVIVPIYLGHSSLLSEGHERKTCALSCTCQIIE